MSETGSRPSTPAALKSSVRVMGLVCAGWVFIAGLAWAEEPQPKAPITFGPSAEQATEPSPTPAPRAAQTQTIDGGGEQRLMFRVTAPASAGYDGFLLELTRLGKDVTIRLSDDGSNPEDVAFDGVFSGGHTGHYARTVTVRLFGSVPDGEPTLLYSGIERTDDVHQELVGWRVIRRDQDFTAVRAPAAYPGNITEVHVGLPLLVAFGWGGIVLVYVGFLFQRRREP